MCVLLDLQSPVESFNFEIVGRTTGYSRMKFFAKSNVVEA